jgi:hypothetical protein
LVVQVNPFSHSKNQKVAERSRELAANEEEHIKVAAAKEAERSRALAANDEEHSKAARCNDDSNAVVCDRQDFWQIAISVNKTNKTTSKFSADMLPFV